MFKREFLGPGNLSRPIEEDEACFSRCPICGYRLEDNGTCTECGYTGNKVIMDVKS